jgi:hypothetical protein
LRLRLLYLRVLYLRVLRVRVLLYAPFFWGDADKLEPKSKAAARAHHQKKDW